MYLKATPYFSKHNIYYEIHSNLRKITICVLSCNTYACIVFMFLNIFIRTKWLTHICFLIILWNKALTLLVNEQLCTCSSLTWLLSLGVRPTVSECSQLSNSASGQGQTGHKTMSKMIKTLRETGFAISTSQGLYLLQEYHIYNQKFHASLNPFHGTSLLLSLSSFKKYS